MAINVVTVKTKPCDFFCFWTQLENISSPLHFENYMMNRLIGFIHNY